MKKIAVILLIIVLCSFIVSASSKFILKVDSDWQITIKQAIEDVIAHPFVLYFKLGVYYFHQGKFYDAIKAFGKAVEIKPDFAEAYHNIGVSYYELSNLDEAIVEFKKSVEVKEDYIKGHYSLALAYYEKKDYEQTITELKKVVELDPLNAQAYFDLGIVYVERFRTSGEGLIEDLEQGLIYYNKCLEINPEFPHAKENKEIVEKVINKLLNN